MSNMKTQQRGVALLEVLIAVLILGIGVLGTIGLQARAYSALSDAGMRSEATMACEKLIGLMSNDQDNLDSYALAAGGAAGARLAPWLSDTTARIPGATVTVTIAPLTSASQVAIPLTSASQVDILIRWIRKTGDKPTQHRVTTYISPS
jgi:type IV pilus assembly protein PilV